MQTVLKDLPQHGISTRHCRENRAVSAYERTRKTMAEFGKLLVFLGVVLLAAGIVLLLLGRTHLPIGRLPGHFLYRGKNTTFYFPLATSLLISVILSAALYLLSRFRR